MPCGQTPEHRELQLALRPQQFCYVTPAPTQISAPMRPALCVPGHFSHKLVAAKGAHRERHFYPSSGTISSQEEPSNKSLRTSIFMSVQVTTKQAGTPEAKPSDLWQRSRAKTSPWEPQSFQTLQPSLREMPWCPQVDFQEGPLKSGCGFRTAQCAEYWGYESYECGTNCSSDTSMTAPAPPPTLPSRRTYS